MSEIKSAQEAVEVLKQSAEDHSRCFAFSDNPEMAKIDAALAFLDGLHIYASRYAVGENVWTYHDCHDGRVYYDERSVLGITGDGLWLSDTDYYEHETFFEHSQIFPTKADAQADYAKRNAK